MNKKVNASIWFKDIIEKGFTETFSKLFVYFLILLFPQGPQILKVEWLLDNGKYYILAILI